MEKTDKDLFDEEIKAWPEELEKIAEEINKKYGLITENINSIDDFLKYAETCIPWEEYKKDWMSTEELIQKLNAVPLEEFINDLREEIRNYPNDNIC